jgi:hypothetical protein
MDLFPHHLSIAAWAALCACGLAVFGVALSWLLPTLRNKRDLERTRNSDYDR